MMMLSATILSFLFIFLMQEGGVLTKSKMKLTIAIVCLIASALLYSMEYGTLRGILILMGVLSLQGTLFTLFRYKLIKA